MILDINEVDQILVNYLFEHDKIKKKETNICWHIDSSNIEKSTVTIEQNNEE